MSEQTESQQTENVEAVQAEETPVTEAATDEKKSFQGDRRDRRGPRQPRREKSNKPDDGIDHEIINIRRVSRMYKGGRHLRMSVFVAVGDRAGHVGVGLGKGLDVQQAQTKAIERAKRSMIMVDLKGNTLPHETQVKYKATKLILKPAAPGTGIVAGGTVKAILELAGVKDLLTKVMGSTNQVNVSYATIQALQDQRQTRL